MTISPTIYRLFLWSITDTLVMARRNLLRYIRLPQLLVFSTVQPAMFVLLFAFVFGGAIDVGPGRKYVDFLLPGIFVQAVLFGTIQTGVGLADDLTRGMIDRYKSLPMARSAVIAERILADMLRNLFVVTLMIGVGYLIGFRFHAGVASAMAVPFVAVLFGLAFSWVSAMIGISVKDAETSQVAGFVTVFPFVFISSIFVPVETMPSWLEAVANVSPVTTTVNTLRGLSLGGPVATPFLQSLAWIIGILVVFVPLSVARYRRV